MKVFVFVIVLMFLLVLTSVFLFYKNIELQNELSNAQENTSDLSIKYGSMSKLYRNLLRENKVLEDSRNVYKHRYNAVLKDCEYLKNTLSDFEEKCNEMQKVIDSLCEELNSLKNN